jgi:hypothetical protein
MHKTMESVKVWGRSLHEADAPAVGKPGVLSKWIVRCCTTAFIFLMLMNRSALAQQPQQQPLQTFGYVFLLKDGQLPADPQLNPRNYADWAYMTTDPSAPDGIINLTGALQTLHGGPGERPLKAIIDLGGLLWEKVSDNPPRYDHTPITRTAGRLFVVCIR